MTADTLKVRVRAITELSERTRTYEFVSAANGTRLPPFTAGAHIAVRLPSRQERQYSLLNDPAEASCYRVAVQREDNGRGGSAEMHRKIHVGDVLTVTVPRNLFPLEEAAADSLLIGGGVGLTPILSMTRELARKGAAFRVLYLARDPDCAAFADEISALKAAGHCADWHFDFGDPARSYDLASLLDEAKAETHVYCCGPTGLVDAVRWLTAGWPTSRVHFEHFTNADAGAREGDRPFDVVLVRTGRTVSVAAGQTILDALLAEGIDVDYSCTEGTCGTCITPLLDGLPDHRDKVLLPSEKGDSIVICCSRARSERLTLDL